MLPKKIFGRTGHESTRTLFGAAALGGVTQEEADKTLEVLLEYGINHLDTANSYGDAELRMGPWMDNHRDKFFLATKTGERTYDEAMRHLELSLERMHTDHIDLWQMHFLVGPEEWEVAMGPGGVLEAFIKARDEGIVDYLGVTGHGITVADMHLKSLERFDFDSVLLPYNIMMWQNPEYRASTEKLFAVAEERNVVVQAIKTICRRPWGDQEPTRACWYEPLEAQKDLDLAVHWALSNPQVFLNTVGDIYLMPSVLDAAARFDPAVSQEEIGEQIKASEIYPSMVPLFPEHA